MKTYTYWFAFADTVFDIALEDDTIRFCETEGLIAAFQRTAYITETGKDIGIHRAAAKVTF